MLDATQIYALWYIGGMVSGALVMIAFLTAKQEGMKNDVV